MSEDPVKVCPTCGAPAERQLSTGAGLLFKGSGFYITDYRSDDYRKAAKADAPDKAPSAETGSSKDAPAKDVPAKDGSAKDGPAKNAAGSSGTASSKDE
ncbi:hypothetical protein BH23GEM10_BH23GEM10_08940 [soil metagenome]